VNRTGSIFATALVVGLLLAAPAGAQVTLVVGSVRDQDGSPIVGALVAALGTAGNRLSAGTTDAAGTFSVAGEDASAVAISCRYCQSRTVAVSPGTPVVAIVRRFDALFYDSPSPQDLANLPYARVESAMALHPFALLRQTTAAIPGSQLSDRGLQPAGALVVDAGVPNYDASFGTSPYDAIPADYERIGSIAPPSDAFLYGDRAASGIVSLEPFGGDEAVVATAGGDTIARFAAGNGSTGAVAGTYSNDTESRQRADGRWSLALSSAQTLQFSGGTSQDREYGDPSSTLDGSYSFANAAFDDAQPSLDLHAAFVTDRGGYLWNSGGLPVSDVWSDAQLTAGVRGQGSVAAFADVSDRLSTGIYDAAAYYQPRIAGTLAQNRVDAGLDATGPGFEVTAGAGLFGVGYTGGWGGTSLPSFGHLVTPSLALRLFPDSRWSANLDASGSFTLPSLWQQYGLPDSYGQLVYDRNSLYDATLSYTDEARVRVSVEAATQRVSGYTNGLVTSSGASVAWQIAPSFALRAWTMYVGDSTAPPAAFPYYPAGMPSNVNAFWLTYENGSAVRIDAIYRRDVLNEQPFEHLDAAISGPLGDHVRWYAGVEDRLRTTYLDFGVRLTR
jgi:hypothetical protein